MTAEHGSRHRKAYLGDGLYAFTTDGWYIWLRAEREGSVHEIALEGPVMRKLEAFAAAVWKREPEPAPDMGNWP